MKKAILVLVLTLCMLSGTAQPSFTQSYPDTLNKQRLGLALGTEIGAYAAGLSYLSFVWYKDHKRVPFHYYNDSKGYLQMDKCGHAFGAYRESYAAYYALRWAGLDKRRSLLYGGPIGLIFQTPIEFFDGMYAGWGFSWSDMAANTFGSLLFVSQEALFDDQLVLMKFSYAPSIYPDLHAHLGETLAESFFLDYNAHTYWLSGGIKSLTGIEQVPDWLNLALGYSANGMIYEFDNPQWYNGKPFPKLERHRQFLFSLDVNFTKIPTKRKWLRKVFRVINILKVPFPALEYNRVDGFKMQPLYF